MFPGPGANIIRNEAGEPLGWDYPSEQEPEDHFEDDRDFYPEEDEDEQDEEYVPLELDLEGE